jgi:hypothetical protein
MRRESLIEREIKTLKGFSLLTEKKGNIGKVNAIHESKKEDQILGVYHFLEENLQESLESFNSLFNTIFLF